ncbi:transglycosylase SLT domain-containing protein [Celerinatantimonas sp. YJH-8]|uniref:transglycosylase SLT domain-containing protein n=1 Tax=Celerinatantimonas sp. YJH-8 TaxID=3228714 RepID=UPI0038C45BB7
MVLWWRLILLFGLFALSQNSFSQPLSLTQQRDLYHQARQAQQQQQWTIARDFTRQLQSYPLYSYLQYFDLENHFDSVSYTDIVTFRHQHQGTPLANQLERRYLFWLAEQQKWAALIRFYPREPSSPSLQCSYYYAHYQTGKTKIAWQGAKKLWLVGKSQPHSCDLLFKAWKQHHHLTQELIWQRLLLAYANYQGGLQNYLQKQLHSQYLAAANQLKLDDATPEKLMQHRYQLSPLRRQTLRLVLMRLTWQQPKLAIAIYQRYQHQLTRHGQVDKPLLTQLIRSAIRYPSALILSWADQQLKSYPEPETVERRLRLALSNQDWGDVGVFLALLTSEQAQDERWQYWQARLAQQQGQDDAARKIWQQLAKRRSYYGFLSAQQLGQEYQFNSESMPETVPDKAEQSLGWQQVRELMYQQDYQAAYQRWQFLLNAQPVAERTQWGMLAMRYNWPALAVTSTIKARAWDMLPLRFPFAYSQEFTSIARRKGLDPLLLVALARQESGFYRYAHSHAGARGLMQITSATARHLMSLRGKRLQDVTQLYSPQMNIDLGSQYLAQLLQQYQGNRFVAIAAYNAGPTRINDWFDRFGALPGDIWIEAIPFNETRHYVQNILSFELIYAYRLGAERELLRPEERMVSPALMMAAKD